MTVTQVVELIAAAGGAGGGIKAIATLTRLTIAVETAAERITALVKDHAETKATVQDHENRLNRGGL